MFEGFFRRFSGNLHFFVPSRTVGLFSCEFLTRAARVIAQVPGAVGLKPAQSPWRLRVQPGLSPWRLRVQLGSRWRGDRWCWVVEMHRKVLWVRLVSGLSLQGAVGRGREAFGVPAVGIDANSQVGNLGGANE